jgi:hypothetical protein
LYRLHDRALLRDALLQLAPGYIQALAAITDRWFARAQADGATHATDKDATDGPPIGAIGGMVNSCHMWREEGPLIAERERTVARFRAASEGE